ncbi:hypothetical protein DID88_005465 [Monilinia fructigena]|uniref:Peptidase A1 domain-containing protein n=1 Tax=Monilinia fructigena TaxID=38457 RepID=A0A395IZX9_9HELO|nr:hypothetical protein DID88_005465 [Monilinia fructigena]
MRPTTSVAGLLALNNLAPIDAPNVISMPIRYLYGELNKITTSVMVGQGNEEVGQSIEVVVDYGSSDFWVFGPNATVNYGSQFLGFSGACNTTQTSTTTPTTPPSPTSPAPTPTAGTPRSSKPTKS